MRAAAAYLIIVLITFTATRASDQRVQASTFLKLLSCKVFI